jgi:hypothetical protein
MEAMRLRGALLLAGLAAALAVLPGCSDEGSEQVDAPPPLVDPTPFERMLGRLPDRAELHRQILFGDLVRLRQAHPDAESLGEAIVGVWLPDALAGATRPFWRRTFGFGLGAVDAFVAAGFHPEQLTLVRGRFRPDAIRATLRAHGYARDGRLMTKGGDGALDPGSRAGRLALGSLNRVVIGRTRLIAASTTALAQAGLDPGRTLADDPGLALAARSLGPVTAAVILPAELVRPPAGSAIAPIAAEPATLVGVGVDDGDAGGRVIKIAIVYETDAAASAEAQLFEDSLPSAELPVRGATVGELLGDPIVSVQGGRAVLVEGRLPAGEDPGLWRGLLESGDLAVLVA